MLSALRSRGIRSLMVEGGATVIKSFLSSATSSSETSSASGLVDTVIVTVAPVHNLTNPSISVQYSESSLQIHVVRLVNFFSTPR